MKSKKERWKQLLKWFRLAKFWVRDRLFGSKCEEIVYNALRQDGYAITVNPDANEGLGLSKERKIELAKEGVFKPDAIMTKNGESLFIDVKGKTSQSFLGYVNVRDYHKYWRDVMRLNAKMRIYFYIEETREIWYHELRNPEQSPTFNVKHYRDGDVYTIPKEEIELYKKL